MLEALRNAREAEWEKSNPKAKEKGETFNRASVTLRIFRATLVSRSRNSIASLRNTEFGNRKSP
jgi:hypothetical protein